MGTDQEAPRVVSASRKIAAGPERIFELIADPAAQPRWDGNDNLASAPAGQRVRRTGDVFTMTLTRGQIRENHVTEFEESRLTARTPGGHHARRPAGVPGSPLGAKGRRSVIPPAGSSGLGGPSRSQACASGSSRAAARRCSQWRSLRSE